MPVFWLSQYDTTFPHPELANEDGILAIGGDLSAERLAAAYRLGVFPWFNPQDPILWWSPDPRFVLEPKNLHIPKSMRPYFNQRRFELSFNKAFVDVMSACQQVYRQGQGGGTWISDDMIKAYTELHQAGLAHSLEVWKEGTLVGGLYGVSMGKIFFGESMFTFVDNAAKFALIALVRMLHQEGFNLIDCQQQTSHLARFGAHFIRRETFQEAIQQNNHRPNLDGDWNRMIPDDYRQLIL